MYGDEPWAWADTWGRVLRSVSKFIGEQKSSLNRSADETTRQRRHRLGQKTTEGRPNEPAPPPDFPRCSWLSSATCGGDREPANSLTDVGAVRPAGRALPPHVADYTERWLERRDPEKGGDQKEGRYTRTRLSHSTHREYQRSLELYILPALGRRPLSQITPADIDQLIARMEREGRAGWTIRNAVGPLRKLLADAARHGLIQTNRAPERPRPPSLTPCPIQP